VGTNYNNVGEPDCIFSVYDFKSAPTSHKKHNQKKWRNREPRPCLGSTNFYY